ncbi:hypothetical protein [Gordonia sp. NPDC003422]
MTDERPRRVVDLTASIVIWFCHVLLAVGVFGLSVLTTFGTDACAYEACGSPRWIDAAIWTAAVGSLALLLASALVINARGRARRLAFPFALIGCVLEVALVPVVFAIASNAGPL